MSYGIPGGKKGSQRLCGALLAGRKNVIIRSEREKSRRSFRRLSTLRKNDSGLKGLISAASSGVRAQRQENMSETCFM